MRGRITAASRRLEIAVAFGLGLGGLGCDQIEALETEHHEHVIVDVEAWALVSAQDDPLGEHRPATIDCPVAAWRPEAGALEIQTGVCNYLAVEQATLAPLHAGELLSLDLWHDELDAAEPGLGHFALLLDGELLDEIEVEIPSPAGVHQLAWTVDRDRPAGLAIGLHLHNHGFNAWTVVEIAVD